MREIKRKEYRIPLEEFAGKFSISEKITNINYYPCNGPESKEIPEVNVIVEVPTTESA